MLLYVEGLAGVNAGVDGDTIDFGQSLRADAVGLGNGIQTFAR